MGAYEVDPGQLRLTSSRLGGVRRAIELDARRISASTGSLGSARLADRLQEVAANWSEKRELVLGHLGGMAGALDAAADAYADTDAGVARTAAAGRSSR